jgi:acetyl esterase/lipase
MQTFGADFLSPSKEGWFIPVSIDPPLPSDEFKKDIREVIEGFAPGMSVPQTPVLPVVAEWQGIPQPPIPDDKLSDKDRFRIISENVQMGPVLLTLHGGSYIRGDPAMERPGTFKLAKICGGRVFAVDYRLAPQHPFPAALIDAVVAYLYLLFPPTGALHKPIDPSKIVIVGASAGVPPSLFPY